ncbi:MAG: aldose 1-epimerase family protein [Bacteroidia bacterium]|jgi:galactose mutarotase-like enzyme|tara:strand:- start:4823 stop:5677 length:855 start_codon:yes stop_codon:yes gene_type:complete
MLEQYTIQNEYLEVTIKKKGAELCSVLDSSGFEYMWQAGEIWPRHAPNLFPIVGSLLDHQYEYEGELYDMSHHGFARNMDFDMLHQSEHSISFVLTHSVDTLTSYPFQFTFLISYTLAGDTLEQRFRVINKDSKNIPVSFGAHPAFNASPVSDYSIVFSDQESVKSNKLSGPYISDQEVDIIEGNVIRLDGHTFDNDALIFQKLRSKEVSLVHNKSNHKITMDVSAFPYLGIWAKPGAPYVCLEPWQGLADYETHSKRIEDKKGIVLIEEGAELKKSFIMTFTK